MTTSDVNSWEMSFPGLVGLILHLDRDLIWFTSVNLSLGCAVNVPLHSQPAIVLGCHLGWVNGRLCIQKGGSQEHISLITHTHPFNGPFFQDYPGEPVPER